MGLPFMSMAPSATIIMLSLDPVVRLWMKTDKHVCEWTQSKNNISREETALFLKFWTKAVTMFFSNFEQFDLSYPRTQVSCLCLEIINNVDYFVVSYPF